MKHLTVVLFAVIVLLASPCEGAVDQVPKAGTGLTAPSRTAHETATATRPHPLTNKEPEPNQNRPSNEADNKIEFLWRWLAPVLLGGLGATVINIYWSHRSRKREAAGLTLILAAEFITGFNRCVTYYDQSSKGEISYSSLFILSDASVLSKFATLVAKADIVMAAIDLKSYFFQIERHAEAASRFIMDASATEDIFQAGPLQARARAEQGAAVGFFLSPYDEIVQDLNVLIVASSKGGKQSVTESLQKRFGAAMEKKASIDALRQAASTETPAKSV
jgi:hypothetical protein